MSDALYFSIVNGGDFEKTNTELNAYRDRMLQVCADKCEYNLTCKKKFSNHMHRCLMRSLMSISP